MLKRRFGGTCTTFYCELSTINLESWKLKDFKKSSIYLDVQLRPHDYFSHKAFEWFLPYKKIMTRQTNDKGAQFMPIRVPTDNWRLDNQRLCTFCL
jgi:hypothetical protein